MNLLTAQIEVAVLEPDLFGIFLVAEYGHRKLGCCRLNGHLSRAHFDLAGREIVVHRIV